MFGVLAIAAVAASACGGDDSSSDDARPEPSPGGDTATDSAAGCDATVPGSQLSFGVYSQTNGLDPTMVSGGGVVGGIETAALYDVLVRWDPETGEWQPHVAESLEPNDDFTQWTLKLRPGVRFGNGDPLTAEMVKASIERHQADDSPSTAKSYAQFVSSMTVVDDLTLVFDLDRPWSSFPYMLGHSPGMVTNVNVANAMGAEQFNLNPAGAGVGPYEIVKFVQNDEIVMRAKPDYWGGPVCIETLRFVFIVGAPLTYEHFKQGQLQAAFLREPETIAAAHKDGYDGYSAMQYAGGVILMNHGTGGSTPPTADVRVRKAIQHALDHDLMNERINRGTGVPGRTVLLPDSPLYPDVDGLEHDLDEARRLVEEAKKDGWNGRIRLICPNSPQGESWAMVTEAQLNDIGMEVVNETGPDHRTRIAQVAVRGDFELACWGLNIAAPGEYVTLYRNLHSESPNNRLAYRNPEMDAAIEKLGATSDLDAQRDAMAEIQRVFNETVPVAVHEATEERIVWADNVKGIVPTLATIVLFHDAYIDD